MKLTTAKLATILLLSALLPVWFVVTLAKNKPAVPHSSEHRTPGDFWHNVRMLPVKVTEIKGSTVYWTFEDKGTVELGSFETEERTHFPKDFGEGKSYLVIYCETHKIAYEFVDWR